MDTELAYQVIRKVISDGTYTQALMTNADEMLLAEGITDPSVLEELKRVLNVIITAKMQTSKEFANLQEWIAHQRETTGNTADTFKEGLQNTLGQIERGFRSTATMYKVGFYLGVALIIFSAIFAVVRNEPVLPIVFAGFGVADVITFFITKPPQQLQRSRADLAQLQAAYFNWFGDSYNWNSFLGIVGQIGNPQIIHQIMKEVSATMLDNTAKTMDIIEKYCEFVEPKGKTSK